MLGFLSTQSLPQVLSLLIRRWGVNAGDQVTYQQKGQGWSVASGYTAANRILSSDVESGTISNLSIPHQINGPWMNL
jgi:hypothetical protein